MTLNDLAIKHNTDKASFCHNYCPIYESLFGRWRHQVMSILEIGISEGASLRMWAEYFPSAIISGIDLEEFNQNHRGVLDERVFTYVADQSKRMELLNIIGKGQSFFDIIIDDGSHDQEHQIISLTTLYPFLKIGGIYVIEDCEFPERIKPFLQSYNYYTSTAKSEIGNSNLIIIIKD